MIQNEDMAVHTSFRVGGPARLMLTVENRDELKNLVVYFNRTGHKYFILGNGSNLLVSDKGYDGIVIRLSGEFAGITVDGQKITCGAGALLSQVSHEAADRSLSGMEFASGIPGSVGGAIVMNAGAYDGEMSRIVETVEVLTPEGEFLTLENMIMEFGYRTSIIRNSEYIVTEVTLSLQNGDREEIAAKMNDLAGQRRARQPLDLPSAGSTFKRPEGNYAGKLIMDAGMRGFQIGGARVSDKHCGFIVNVGYASASDIYDVICEVQDRVKSRFNVKLEPEVILLGDF
ncbi:MAG: UDP-N-acetylmuramate dehydrogenase [Lachnospiraceae bacterium]|nr:UDP-N-acetylmuramate dehydrogenase [Lachnospiraceae bacterium]